MNGSPIFRLPHDRWKPLEIAFWLIPIVAYFVFPDYLVLGSQILIVGLFAVTLDLILGYAGIVSLGHAAFFGVGAYTAGLLAAHGWGEPISGLLAAAIAAGSVGFLASFLVVRGGDLTRLMVTLGIGLMLWEAANKAHSITGGVDGLSGVTIAPILGMFAFDIGGRTAYVYALVVVFIVFVVVRRVVNSPFGLSLRGIREGGKRMPALGAPVARPAAIAVAPEAPLGGDEDVVAPALQGLGDQALAVADVAVVARIGVGGVDEVDARVEGGVDRAYRLLLVGTAIQRHGHLAQADGIDVDAGE